MRSRRFPEEVLRSRLERFQRVLRARHIDAVMLRTLGSFIYFAGIKWLRPALLIPAEGEPTAFIAKGEETLFRELTWIDDLVTYAEGGEVMSEVSKTIRERGFSRVGLEFGLERDAYILFYEMFKKLNPHVEVVDVAPILYDMRMIKDSYELDAIRKAGAISLKALEKAESIVEPGISETEIAAELYHILYRSGSEDPLVYVNVGPGSRVHAEPLRDIVVKNGVFVTVVVGADYNRYYANSSRTFFVGDLRGEAEKALKCMESVYRKAVSLSKPGTKLIAVMKELDKVYMEYGLLEHRVIGYAHSVGLQVEEPPITTIVPKHRTLEIKSNMALAFIHAPLMMPGLGQVKIENTFIVKEDGSLESVTGSI